MFVYYSTVKVIRACLFRVWSVLEVTQQRVPPTCTTKTSRTFARFIHRAGHGADGAQGTIQTGGACRRITPRPASLAFLCLVQGFASFALPDVHEHVNGVQCHGQGVFTREGQIVTEPDFTTNRQRGAWVDDGKRGVIQGRKINDPTFGFLLHVGQF